MELADEQRDWVGRCEELLLFADKDGIVCIPSVMGEPAASDRLSKLLAASFDIEWNPYKLDELLANADARGKSLEWWLREKFFEQHFKLFHHRPFIWQIWDGQRDGFSALVNYHKLNKSLLERLIYTCLEDWIQRQRSAVDHLESGADARLTAALDLEKKLKLILIGESPHDIFVRWKPAHLQPIGWEPDLNDGVRLNIRPFMLAGVLRGKPNIKWEKDRGKDVASAPWFHKFKGDRINDHHLTLKEKRDAREEWERGPK